MPPESGIVPPVRPLAAPRGVTAMPCSKAIFITAETSALVRGRTTSSGLCGGTKGVGEES